jgi:hypothetical protein
MAAKVLEFLLLWTELRQCPWRLIYPIMHVKCRNFYTRTTGTAQCTLSSHVDHPSHAEMVELYGHYFT